MQNLPVVVAEFEGQLAALAGFHVEEAAGRLRVNVRLADESVRVS
jgi:hypothetical protein